MTSQTETTDFDMNFMDLLRKKFSEEKKAHEETTLQLLSAQAQAHTSQAEATKAQELVAETTLKLDQACEEIKRLRVLTRGGQVQALKAQAKIESLEAQMAQMRLSEQSQAQSAIEAQEEVRSLRAQAQESQKAHAETQESLAQELETARAKIASLEAAVAKARAAFAEVATSPDSTAQDQAQELKAAQVKIESLEVQVAQMKLFEQFQAQAEELKAALAKITELENQMAQSEKQALHRKTQAEELERAKAQVKDLEFKVAQAQEEVRTLKAQTGAQAQKLQEAQAEICSLEAQIPEPPAPAIMCERYTVNREYFNQYFCIVQNGIRLYFQRMDGCEIFTKFIPKRNATLELVPGVWFSRSFRVTISDGHDWKEIGHIGPENKTILLGSLVWSWVTKRTPSRINADGNEEYQLAICVDI